MGFSSKVGNYDELIKLLGVNNLIAKNAGRHELEIDPKTLWHWTENQRFNAFDEDIWPHLGTKEQALIHRRNRSNRPADEPIDPSAETLFELNARHKNPLTMRDIGGWDLGNYVSRELLNTDAFPHRGREIAEIYKSTKNISDPLDIDNISALDQLRYILEDEGFDSIKYDNRFENPSGIIGEARNSIIPLRANQIRDVGAKFDPSKWWSPDINHGLALPAIAALNSQKGEPGYFDRAPETGQSAYGEERPVAQAIGDFIGLAKLPIVGELMPSLAKLFREAGQNHTGNNALAAISELFAPLGLDYALEKIIEEEREP